MSDAFVPRKIEKNLMPKQLQSSIPLNYYGKWHYVTMYIVYLIR